MKNLALTLALALGLTSGLRSAEKTAAVKPAAKADVQPGPERLGMLPEQIEGVTPEELAKFKIAMRAAWTDEKAKAAREHLAELRKQAEYASDDEKKKLRPDFESAMEELRIASRDAVAKADPSLSRETIEKIQDAIRERIKKRAAENAKGGKTGAAPAKKKGSETDSK
jgi:hypothetical protein